MASAPDDLETHLKLLNETHAKVQKHILSKQHPDTGLFPASTATNEHGDYTDAWIRDNVYSVTAVWALAVAYRKVEDDAGRAFELEQSVIKLMRGILSCYMRQAHKVEKFKHTQDPLDCLHAKYDTSTGNPVVGDDEWGHLQLDATSLFLLFLAQITASGMRICRTQEEVKFIQNLVYYIELAYRTPDYGVWERGNKVNNGMPEINTSSFGMAKAALEAIDNMDLFGGKGALGTTIHVTDDEVARGRLALRSTLPRESASKEIDAALLSVIGFPAFAEESAARCELVRNKIVSKLQGRYGCKRFLRDGHQCPHEEVGRLHYKSWELAKFTNTECEWPLFFTYFHLDAIFRGDLEEAAEYRKKLIEVCGVNVEGEILLPEVYMLKMDQLDAERANPGSQDRIANENLPLVWAQSLFLVGEMLAEGLIDVEDIDPLGRSKVLRQQTKAAIESADPATPSRRPEEEDDGVAARSVNVLLLAEDDAVRQMLHDGGATCHVPHTFTDILQIRQAEDLVVAYTNLGASKNLGLTGRPLRTIESLVTCKLYSFDLRRTPVLFMPAALDGEVHYCLYDAQYFIHACADTLKYISENWRHDSPPTLAIMLSQTLVSQGVHHLLKMCHEMDKGAWNGVPVSLVTPEIALEQGEQVPMGFLKKNYKFQGAAVDLPRPPALTQDPGAQATSSLIGILSSCKDLDEQFEILDELVARKGLDFDTGMKNELGEALTLRYFCKEVLANGTRKGKWAVVRGIAARLNNKRLLRVSVQALLAANLSLTIGTKKENGQEFVFQFPMVYSQWAEVDDALQTACGGDRITPMLTQEIVLYLRGLMVAEPELFKNIRLLRINHILQFLARDVARLGGQGAADKEEYIKLLATVKPWDVRCMLRNLLTSEQERAYDPGHLTASLARLVVNLTKATGTPPVWTGDEGMFSGLTEADEAWLRRRELEGMLHRLPDRFYPRCWLVLSRSKALKVGGLVLSHSPVCSETTPNEPNFAKIIDDLLLANVDQPEYRQVAVEALMVLGECCHRCPNFTISDELSIDTLVELAVVLLATAMEGNPAATPVPSVIPVAPNVAAVLPTDEKRAAAYKAYYSSDPCITSAFLLQAVSLTPECAGFNAEEFSSAENLSSTLSPA